MSNELSVFLTTIASQELLKPEYFKDDALKLDYLEAIGTAAFKAGLGWPHATIKALESIGYTATDIEGQSYRFKQIRRTPDKGKNPVTRGRNASPRMQIGSTKRDSDNQPIDAES